jgi:biotin carboxyl carrier protein
VGGRGRLAERAVKLTLEIGGERRELQVHRTGSTITVELADGRRLAAEVERGADGLLVLSQDGRQWRAAGVANGSSRQLWVAGRTLGYAVVPAAGAPREAGALPMASPIPAVVRELLVEPGEVVAVGQRLLLLESMKMVLPIVASRSGRVRAIVCRPGDAVAPGLPLVEIEDA